ncbi:hypothetical protein VCRLGP7_200128 [Vibrio crassostreae]|nr:hypothetical protein VCRLGP7_200128 [Vibrio crassostreae]CDT59608.1 hypothetical protein VCRLGP107_760176 [Vibrio crassostreae]
MCRFKSGPGHHLFHCYLLLGDNQKSCSLKTLLKAPWQSGYAADCKSVDLGSTPGGASTIQS